MRPRNDTDRPAPPADQDTNGATLRRALTWIVDDGIFDHLSCHGNTKWLPIDLVVLAVLWVWSDCSTLTGAFARAARWARSLFGRVALDTYQGLSAALLRWTAVLLPLLWRRLHQRMQQCGGAHWRVGGWLALAVDGSRVSAPRTRANEAALCAARWGSGKTARYRKKKRRGPRRRRRQTEPVRPQVWTTLLWHMGLRLPWSWKSGPSTASERDHFRAMLLEQRFPEDTLFCGDAGFTGYGLWKAISDAGHSFLIRVGANVTLLRRLGYVRQRDGIVCFWPDKAARQLLPPLVLRLFHFQIGRCRMALVSNVVDDTRLSVEQARQLYKLRWGIELQFRSLKQTFGRRKLRSKTPQRALVELDWSLLGLTMIQLLALKEQVEPDAPPPHSSVALAIAVIRAMFDCRAERSRAGADLGARLRGATVDQYKRTGSKRGRYRPGYKDKPAAGRPKVIAAQGKHKVFLRNFLAQTPCQDP